MVVVNDLHAADDNMTTTGDRLNSLERVLGWLEDAPDGTTVDAHTIAELLSPLVGKAPAILDEQPVDNTWRERLWTAPAGTRLGVQELAEALGRPRSWVYARTSRKSQNAPLPHRKLDGSLYFVAGEVRSWLQANEVDIQPIRRRTTSVA